MIKSQLGKEKTRADLIGLKPYKEDFCILKISSCNMDTWLTTRLKLLG